MVERVSSSGVTTLPSPEDPTPEGGATGEPAPASTSPELIAAGIGFGYTPSFMQVGGPSYSGGGSTSSPSSTPEPSTTTAPSSTPPAAPSGTAPTASPSGGTHVFNNLAGRDPDLLYAGETVKIEVNGKVINHVVKSGETLSSIAANNGVSVAALIKTNGMDNDLLGKNSAGNYFVSGGPQPAPGSTSLTSHAGSTSTSSPDATPPVPDTTTELQPNTHLGTADISQPHSKDTLEITLANIGRMENSTDQNVKPSAAESKAWRALIDRAMRGEKLSEADETELVRIEKYVHDTIGPQRLSAPTLQA
jgi:LysM repeat protein